jgi:preprotein translocase subunit SecG
VPVIIAVIIIIIIIIIIITTPQDSQINISFSGSPNSFFKGHPSRHIPFDLKFNTIFAILLLLILGTCRRKFDLYLCIFISTGFACLPSENVYLQNMFFVIDTDIDILINCNWFDTRWQYTFTHKQYIEQHK